MDTELLVICVFLGFVAAGALTHLAARGLRAHVSRALGLKVIVHSTELARCQELRVQAEIKPARPFDLDSVEMTLLCERIYRERRRDGEGFNREKDVLHKESTYVMEGTGPLAAGERKVFAASFTIPGDALSSKRTSSDWGADQGLRIDWYVQVRFHLKGYPDSVERRDLAVSSHGRPGR